MGYHSLSEPLMQAETCLADFSGHLWRQGNRGQWRLQYFTMQGNKLSWFEPASRPHVNHKKPLGSMQLDAAHVEPIVTGSLSDTRGSGRTAATTADAPPGIPPWGIAVETGWAGPASHSEQRLVLAADNQRLRDLWLEVIQHAALEPEPELPAVQHVDPTTEGRHSPQPRDLITQTYASTSEASLSPSQDGRALQHAQASTSRSATSHFTAASGGQTEPREPRGCSKPRLLQCFSANATHSLVLYNDVPWRLSSQRQQTVGRPASTNSQQIGSWSQVSGGTAGPGQSWLARSSSPAVADQTSSCGAGHEGRGGAAAHSSAQQCSYGGTSTRAAGVEPAEREARISVSEWCSQDNGRAGHPGGAAGSHAERRAASYSKQAPGSAGWRVRKQSSVNAQSRSCSLDDVSSLHWGMAPVQAFEAAGWRVRDNASYEGDLSSDEMQGQGQKELPPMPAPASGAHREHERLRYPLEDTPVDPMSHVQNWLYSSLASRLSSIDHSTRTSSSGLQPTAIPFTNSSSVSSISSSRAKVLLEQYQQLLSTVSSVRQHLQVQDTDVTPALNAGAPLHANSIASGSGQGSLRIQLNSLNQVTGQMREALSSLQEQRRLRKRETSTQSCKQ